MKAYIALFRQQFLSRLQYRAAFWSQVVTSIFWAYVHTAIIAMFYRFGSGTASLTLRQAIAFIWLKEIAFTLLPGIGMNMDVWGHICKGEVAYDLVRPLDLYGHWYFSELSARIAPFITAFAPLLLAALITPGELGLRLTTAPLSFLAGLFTLTTGVLFSCAVTCLSYAMCMDVRVGHAPANMFLLVAQVLAGSILPLQLWPDSMQRFLAMQPFAGLMDLPLRFMVGSAALSELPRVLMTQAVWGALIVLLGRFWIGRNLKRLIVQGG